MKPLYNTDFRLWLAEQAKLLRLISRATVYFEKAEKSGKLSQAELMERTLDQDVDNWAKTN